MPDPITRTEARSLPLQTRAVPVASVNNEARTFDTVWTTGARVKRFDWVSWSYYYEELSLDPAHVRLGRLQAGAPVLNSHQQWDLSSVLGVVEKAWMEPGEGRSTNRFSDRDEEVNAYWRDVVSGIIRNVSVGYIVHRYEKTDPVEQSGIPTWTAIDWEPCEISLVPIGADALAGVRGMGEGDRPDPEQLRELIARSVGGRTFPCEFVARAPEVSPPAAAAASTEASATQSAPTQPTDEDSMNRNLRRTPVANAAEAATSTGGGAATTQTTTPTASQRSEADIAAAAAAAERTRIAAIRNAATIARRTAHGAGITDQAVDSMIERNLTLDQARAEIFAVLETASNATGPTRSSAAVQTTQRLQHQRRIDMSAALSHRANPGVVQLPETARRFRGLSLPELARRSLELQGLNTEGLSRSEVVAIAMGNSDAMGFRSMHGTSDFSVALASTVARTLRSAYESAPQTFTRWCRRGTLNDFRAATRVSVAANLKLEKVNEFGEFKRGQIVDQGQTIQLATYGKVIGVTRQTVINDDLDFLARLPQMFGRAARDFESDTVYGVLTGNPALSDGVTLFHANHNNLGTAGVPSETTLSEARRLMRQQKDPSGNNQPLNLVGRFVIGPSTLETTLQKLFQAVIVATKTADTNIFRDSYEPIIEPRLDAASATAWYMAADPAQIDTIEYAYLDGQDGLYTEERMGFDVDGLEVKGRLDFAAQAIDHKGLFKNAG